MIAVRLAPPEHYGWIAERANIGIGPHFRAIEAVDERTGRILGMVGYEGWKPNSCEMHVAIDNPIAVRRLLRPAFGIPFVEKGYDVVCGWVLGTNEKAMAFDRSLGFREAYRMVDGWDKGVDIVLFEMRREECRWIRKEAA